MAVLFNWGSTGPQGSANGIQRFRWVESKNGT